MGATVRTNELVAILMPRMAPVSLGVTDFVNEDVTTTFIIAIAKTTKGTRKYICRGRGGNRMYIYVYRRLHIIKC